MFRVLYGELCGDLCDLAEYENYLQATEALCVNDCKSLTDALLAAGSAVSACPATKRVFSGSKARRCLQMFSPMARNEYMSSL